MKLLRKAQLALSWLFLMEAAASGDASSCDCCTTDSCFQIELNLGTAPSDLLYSPEQGYGYEPKQADVLGSRARRFSINVPEGNYRVTLTLAPTTHVWAETRRLVLEGKAAVAGSAESQPVCRSFLVNIRRPSLPPEKRGDASPIQRVQLAASEEAGLTWDEKLTLEFSEPSVGLLRIETATGAAPTVFLIGDSTVTDQASSDYASWGQMLPRFLPGASIANYARSGETIKSSLSSMSFAKVLSQLKKGDYVLIQFGHNDQKEQWAQTYLAADSTYPAYLRALIADVRRRGAVPYLVSPVQRRNFDASGRIINTHGAYPQAVRDVAAQERVALIDLERMSRALYEALGPDRAKLAFAQNGADRSHHNAYGAYELARCVVLGIREAATLSPQHTWLAEAVSPDFGDYDPSQPIAPEEFTLVP